MGSSNSAWTVIGDYGGGGGYDIGHRKDARSMSASSSGIEYLTVDTKSAAKWCSGSWEKVVPGDKSDMSPINGQGIVSAFWGVRSELSWGAGEKLFNSSNGTAGINSDSFFKTKWSIMLVMQVILLSMVGPSEQ